MKEAPFLYIRLTFSRIVGGKKKECSERGNLACCGALHGTIGTQCEGVEDGQITCAKQALSYRKHKRWSLPLKRALFQKRGDWCDQRGATQQFQDFNEKNPPKPIDNDVGFPAINTAPVGGAVQLFQDLSKSNDKGTKSDPGSTTFDTAPVDFAPVLPADGLFDYSSESDPYFQQNY